MKDEYKAAYSLLNAEVPMNPITPQQLQQYEASTSCYMCQESFTSNNPKCFDHCHYRYYYTYSYYTYSYYTVRYYTLYNQTFSGDYIGPACGICNRERQTDKKLTIVFHNFKSYDVHLLVEDLAKHEKKLSDVKIVPQSMEKYTSVVTKQFRYEPFLCYCIIIILIIILIILNAGLLIPINTYQPLWINLYPI